MKLYWTYSRIDLKVCDVHRHEKGKVRFTSEKYHVGGLNRTPIFTHCICPTGKLHTLEYCPGSEIHLALIGGLDNDDRFKNTATREQLFTLGNICRFYLSLGDPITEGDLSNFDLELWLRAINK